MPGNGPGAYERIHLRKASMSILPLSPIESANAQALQRIYAARPYLVAIRPARTLLPQLRAYTILHAGPPALWATMCEPMRGAMLGALVYEGWATDLEVAQTLAESGRITFQPCHSLSAV